jgi:hypothetical protein
MERRLLRPARQSTTGLLHVLAQVTAGAALAFAVSGCGAIYFPALYNMGRLQPVPPDLAVPARAFSGAVHVGKPLNLNTGSPDMFAAQLCGTLSTPVFAPGARRPRASLAATGMLYGGNIEGQSFYGAGIVLQPTLNLHLGDALCLYGVAELSAALELGPYAERVNIGDLSRLSRSAILVYEPALGAGICIHPSRRSSVSLSGRVFTPPALRFAWWEQTFGIFFLATVWEQGIQGIQGGLTVLLPQPSPRQR